MRKRSVLALALLFGAAGRAPAQTPGPDPRLHLATIRVNGVGRSFLYYAPDNLRRNAPVVFVLHGSGGNGASMRALTSAEFERLADQHNFLVVYPDGFENRWNDCRKNATHSAHTMNIDDGAFLRALVQRFRGELGTSESNVFAFGFSNGGALVLRLALERPREFRAVAAIASVLPTAENLDCSASGRAVPVLLVVGTADPLIRSSGGRGARSAEGTMEYFRGLVRGIGAPEAVTFPDIVAADSSTVERTTWRAKNLELALYTVRGGAHAVPQLLPAGRTSPEQARRNADISAPAEAWAFFARHIR
jgi:polyhydroxybutyrate depolymerase